MSKHTPGPWYIWSVGAADRYIGPPGECAATAIVPLRISTRDAQDANAHLIAAAPDLLAALEALYSVTPNTPPAAGIVVGIEEKHAVALAVTRAAIARAKGEA